MWKSRGYKYRFEYGQLWELNGQAQIELHSMQRGHFNSHLKRDKISSIENHADHSNKWNISLTQTVQSS